MPRAGNRDGQDDEGGRRPGDSIAFLVRHGVAQETLREAERLAALWGVEAGEALLASGLADPDAVYRALAAELGLPFLAEGFAVDPLARFPEAVASGIAPLPARPDGLRFAYAPRGAALDDLVGRRGRLAPEGLALATPDALRCAVFAAKGEAIARHAAEDLPARHPEMSYRDGPSTGQVIAGLAVAGTAWIAAATVPAATTGALALLLGLSFLALIDIKIAAATEPVAAWPDGALPRQADRDLPVYTVLVPLFRERRVLPKLIRALRELDYPAAKLDVKLVVEAEDPETIAALRLIDLPAFVEVIVAPPGAPRTKPRALNVALPLARGRYTVIYDAEDVPDPGQLRLAVSTFERRGPETACLQARLVIDNTADGALPAFFTVEYGALFDVLNPALARFDLPIALGGTSNHFRTDILRDLGGWDAWNVTEDADLGIRLAIAGYRVADLPSATLEEAPAALRAWMAQRTRWMKGFVQVAITHSRHPLRNLRRLGPFRFVAAGVLTGGVVLSALVYPFVGALLLVQALSGRLLDGNAVPTAAGLTLAIGGSAAMMWPGLCAISRRRLPALRPYALLMPLYYLLVSAAAWRALYELVRDTDRWNKTEHGLARTSRAAAARAAGEARPQPVRAAARR